LARLSVCRARARVDVDGLLPQQTRALPRCPRRKLQVQALYLPSFHTGFDNDEDVAPAKSAAYSAVSRAWLATLGDMEDNNDYEAEELAAQQDKIQRDAQAAIAAAQKAANAALAKVAAVKAEKKEKLCKIAPKMKKVKSEKKAIKAKLQEKVLEKARADRLTARRSVGSSSEPEKVKVKKDTACAECQDEFADLNEKGYCYPCTEEFRASEFVKTLSKTAFKMLRSKKALDMVGKRLNTPVVLTEEEADVLTVAEAIGLAMFNIIKEEEEVKPSVKKEKAPKEEEVKPSVKKEKAPKEESKPAKKEKIKEEESKSVKKEKVPVVVVSSSSESSDSESSEEESSEEEE